MMTKNEQIASLLLEAAELLKESAGKNGYISSGESKRDGKDAARYYAKYKETGNPDDKERGDGYVAFGALHTTDFDESNKLTRKYNDYIEKRHKFTNKFADASKDKSHRTDRYVKAAKYYNKYDPLKAIDLLYDKAIEAETMDEAADYINKAEELEAMIESM